MKRICFAILAFLIMVHEGYSQQLTKQEGYFNITELGFFTGLSANYPENRGYKAPNGGSFRTINGFFLSPNWSAGIGVGTDWYNGSHDEGLFSQYHHVLPVFVDGRYYFQDSRKTPFVFADIGYSPSWADNFDKGFMLSIGGGYKFFAGDRTGLVAALGYNMQQIEEPYSESGKLDLYSLRLSLGFLF